MDQDGSSPSKLRLVGLVSEIGLQISDKLIALCPKNIYKFRTMNETVDLKTRILQRISAGAPRSVWTPADFLDLATRDAIDKALQRLAATGTLRRIDRGLYDKPDFNSLTKAPNP